MSTTGILRFPTKQEKAEQLLDTLREELLNNPNTNEMLVVMKDDVEGIYSVYCTPIDKSIETVGMLEVLKAHVLEGIL